MHTDPLGVFKRQLALEELSGLGYFGSVRWVDSIDSTNKSLAQSIRQKSIQLPALLVADLQSAGVGRGSNAWWSPAGCLMFSMAIDLSNEAEWFDPNASAIPRTHSALLPLRVGCTIAECLKPIVSRKPMVKWPNDVYLAGRKVCGVLIEVVPEPATTSAIAVIGIGINCQVDFSRAAPDLKVNATSLHEWTPQGKSELSRPENVLVQFVHHWLMIEKRELEDPNWLVGSWTERSLLDGQWVEVKHSGGVVQGLCVGISQSGALRIQNEQLEVTEVLAGTVHSFRPLAT